MGQDDGQELRGHDRQEQHDRLRLKDGAQLVVGDGQALHSLLFAEAPLSVSVSRKYP